MLSRVVQGSASHAAPAQLEATPAELIQALLYSDEKAVLRLLEQRPGLALISCEVGLNPLLAAAGEGGSIRMVEALLQAGADVDAPYNGTAPLMAAAANGKREVIIELLRAGADPNTSAEYDEGLTPLMSAAASGHQAVIEVLLRVDADVNTKTTYGATALHMAAVNGHCKVIEALLRAGADLTATHEGGMTALDVAEQFGHSAAAKTLQLANAESGQIRRLRKALRDSDDLRVTSLLTHDTQANGAQHAADLLRRALDDESAPLQQFRRPRDTCYCVLV